MKFCHLLPFVFLLSFISRVNANEIMVEQQLRLCDNPATIKSKLLPTQFEQKKFEILYLETSDKLFQTNNWSVRIRFNSSKAELSIKKKVTSDEVFSEMECEFDAHANIIAKKCKIDSKSPLSDLSDVISSKTNWMSLLSSPQHALLKKDDLLFKDAHLYGTLQNERFQWEQKLGEVTLDINSLKSNNKITYHEISIRYPFKDYEINKSLFENFIKASGVKLCENQQEWAIDKFEVLKEIN